MTATLVELPYSPWSRRARQALALEGIAHQRQPYLITLSEPWLRIRTGRLTGPISIPCLIPDEGEAIFDSTEIAAWASERGSARLLPTEHREEIFEVVALSERCLNAGRLRSSARVLLDKDSLRAQVPSSLAWLGPLRVPVARRIGKGILKRYAKLIEGEPAAVLESAIEDLARRVGGGGPLVGGRLTWADLAGASALGFVAPPDDGTLDPATARNFSWPELAARYPELIAWRDDLHAQIEQLTGA